MYKYFTNTFQKDSINLININTEYFRPRHFLCVLFSRKKESRSRRSLTHLPKAS